MGAAPELFAELEIAVPARAVEEGKRTLDILRPATPPLQVAETKGAARREMPALAALLMELRQRRLARCSTGTKPPVPVDEMLRVSTADTLYGRYESRSGTRTAGWVLMGAGTVIGLATIATYGNGDSDNNGAMLTGIGAMGVGLTVGGILAFRPDKASLRLGSDPGAAAEQTNKPTPRRRH